MVKNLKTIVKVSIVVLIIFSNCLTVFGKVDIDDFMYDTLYRDDVPKEFDEFTEYWGDYEYAERKYPLYKYTYSYDATKENLLIYDLSVPSFEKFVKSPCGDTLKELFNMRLSEATVFEVSLYREKLYRENEGSSGKVEEDETIQPVLVNDRNYVVYGIDRFHEWDHISIKMPLLDLLSVDSIQKYLNENGINDKVVDRVLMHTSYYPFVLWVKTENSMYFISLKWVLKRETYDTDIVKKIYSLEEFQSEFVEKNGELIIDGKKVPDGNVTFYKDYPLIKARVVWETLGGREVIWHPEDMSVSFWCNGDKIDFKKEIHGINDYYYYYKNDEQLVSTFRPTLINGSLYWDYEYLEAYLKKEYNSTLTVDTENKRVIIEKIEQ